MIGTVGMGDMGERMGGMGEGMGDMGGGMGYWGGGNVGENVRSLRAPVRPCPDRPIPDDGLGRGWWLEHRGIEHSRCWEWVSRVTSRGKLNSAQRANSSLKPKGML